MLGLENREVREYFEKRANWLADHHESGRLTNHQALIVLCLERAGTLLKTNRWDALKEARLSDLTLGSLHLKLGAAPAAFRHFERYTRSSPDGALAPEALWGQFQALSALGREEEARARLELLLRRFPGSAYASVARGRLEGSKARP
jgi:hypothetical protein